MKIRKTRMINLYQQRYAPDHGFYVEIGAFDGVSKNSTINLENAGWDGVCIEAHPKRFEILKENRKCRCINAAIWNETGEIDFAIMPPGKEGWDGIVETLPERAKRLLHKSEIIKIKSYVWDDLLTPKNVDYLQLDVEGAELHVLDCIDFNQYQIDYICLEDNNYFLSNGKDLTYKKYMINRGYMLVEELGVDCLYSRL